MSGNGAQPHPFRHKLGDPSYRCWECDAPLGDPIHGVDVPLEAYRAAWAAAGDGTRNDDISAAIEAAAPLIVAGRAIHVEQSVLDGHVVQIAGLPDGGTMANCSCGGFNEFDTAYGEDFDDLAGLVTAHRGQAEQDEQAAERWAKINAKRWHVWVRGDDGAEFPYLSFDDRETADRIAGHFNETFEDPDHSWVVDRDAS